MKKKQYISIAKRSTDIQIKELKKIKKIFDNSFIKAVDLILNCKGKVICAGIGKSGLIARKISATFSSIGVPSFFCDPAQALHGDMGQIEKKDILIIFSYSGNTSELTNMLKYANRYRIKIIGVASKPESILLKASDIKLLLPKVKEADRTGLVPTTSTSLTLILGLGWETCFVGISMSIFVLCAGFIFPIAFNYVYSLSSALIFLKFNINHYSNYYDGEQMKIRASLLQFTL